MINFGEYLRKFIFSETTTLGFIFGLSLAGTFTGSIRPIIGIFIILASILAIIGTFLRREHEFEKLMEAKYG